MKTFFSIDRFLEMLSSGYDFYVYDSKGHDVTNACIKGYKNIPQDEFLEIFKNCIITDERQGQKTSSCIPSV